MKKKELIKLIDESFSDDDDILFCDPDWGNYTIHSDATFEKFKQLSVDGKVVENGSVIFGKMNY